MYKPSFFLNTAQILTLLLIPQKEDVLYKIFLPFKMHLFLKTGMYVLVRTDETQTSVLNLTFFSRVSSLLRRANFAFHNFM